MKKLVVLLVLIALGLTMIYAQGAQDQETIVIEHLTRMRAEEYGRDVFNASAAEFEAANPGVEIKSIDVSYDDLRSQMLLKAQAGTPPNISEPVLSWIPQLAGAGILEPITNFMSDVELAKYMQSAIDDSRIDGVPYAVPLWHGPILLYANKELMTKAGLPLRAPADIYEFKSWIEKIGSLGKDKNGEDIVGFSMRNVKSPNSGFWFVPWIWAWGGELVDADGNPSLDTQGFKDALGFYQWCTDSGYSPKGIDAPTSRIIFAQCRAGFVFDGPWLKGMLPGMTDNPDIDNMYEVFTVPNGVNGEPWTIANPTSMVVLSGSENKETAFDFVKYLTASNDVSALLVEKMGVLPTFLEFADNDPSMQTTFVKEFFKQMPYSRGVPWKNESWPGLQDILATAMSQALAGDNLNNIAAAAQQDFLDLAGK